MRVLSAQLSEHGRWRAGRTPAQGFVWRRPFPVATSSTSSHDMDPTLRSWSCRRLETQPGPGGEGAGVGGTHLLQGLRGGRWATRLQTDTWADAPKLSCKDPKKRGSQYLARTAPKMLSMLKYRTRLQPSTLSFWGVSPKPHLSPRPCSYPTQGQGPHPEPEGDHFPRPIQGPGPSERPNLLDLPPAPHFFIQNKGKTGPTVRGTPGRPVFSQAWRGAPLMAARVERCPAAGLWQWRL